MAVVYRFCLAWIHTRSLSKPIYYRDLFIILTTLVVCYIVIGFIINITGMAKRGGGSDINGFISVTYTQINVMYLSVL